ncbi:MAG: hypothetical protein D3916_01475 [Candidatus Electrothrix sp. MAN1_4]|nr:hypothetical protein [Candidatus Electrothrix sp. MAN1_4]
MDVEKTPFPCCQLCGAQEPTDGPYHFQICSSCCSLIETFKKKPALLEKIRSYIQNNPNSYHSCNKDKVGRTKTVAPEFSDVLDGKRYRTIDRDQNKWYLSVSEVDGHPVEIFASTAFDRDHELQSHISNLTTITRLISLILRYIFLNETLTLEKCLKQLQRSSRNKHDLPDMLYRILHRYTNATNNERSNNNAS